MQLSDDEMPFEIPDNWRWVRFGDISTYGNSLSKISPEKIKPDMWCLDLEDIEKGTGTVIQKVYAKDRKIDGDKTLFVSGQILYSKLRPYLLKVLIADEDGICTPELVPFSVFTGLNPLFLCHMLKSAYVDNLVNSKTFGVKMPRVSTETMCNLILPIPPLEEQNRIVAKLEQILPLITDLS